MTDYSWWPGLIVLAAGIAAGAFMSMRLRRSGKDHRQEGRARDLALKIQDLEGRRDDLYSRLRQEADSLTDSDRHQLELAAARTLRALDEVSQELGKGTVKTKAGKRPTSGDEEKEKASDGQAASARGRSLLTGFALGVGLVAVVGVLIYWAVRDTAGQGVPGAAAPDTVHPEATLLSAEAQAEYEALRAQLDRDPGDIMARKRLALLLVSNDQFVPAFQEARMLLEQDPDDIDGLYVEAVVRIQMGQGESAIGLLDRVIELYPAHVQALGWRGIVLYQGGDVTAAIESWERGIEAAGGQHPELEEMVAAALSEEAGLPASEPVASQPVPPGASPADWALAAGAGAAEEEPAAPGTNVFGLRLELAAGVEVPPGVLFVALRPTGGGPPLAVRRLTDFSFPVELTLTENDSMMGSALPESGLIFARLDQDGDVSAASAGDLFAEGQATVGSVTILEMRP
jgi:tetratricopeptide (TPR) repeat protein